MLFGVIGFDAGFEALWVQFVVVRNGLKGILRVIGFDAGFELGVVRTWGIGLILVAVAEVFEVGVGSLTLFGFL